MSKAIGFIGLGNMGGPMASNLAEKGHQVLCFDASGTQERAHPKASCAGSTAKVAAGTETIFLSLPDGKISAAVLEEIIATPERKTKLVVDTSTIGIEWARKNAARAAQAGIEYLDAPVSGGAIGAQKGTIAVMCAGKTATIDALRATLLDFGGHVFQAGTEAGQAQALKVLNNFLSATAMAATSEAVAFGVKVGLDMKTILDVVNVSSGQNTATRDKFPPRVLTETYDAGFRIEQLAKDLALYEEALSASGSPNPISPSILSVWRQLKADDAAGDITLAYPFIRDGRVEV
ncbi:MAG: 3-hydroxyisobutyrate dehydrogenase [Gammaproteobacteria bacterium]|jgi:3-hydroxyisobutyrate dehydrogenase